jgi:hypothetical protein
MLLQTSSTARFRELSMHCSAPLHCRSQLGLPRIVQPTPVHYKCLYPAYLQKLVMCLLHKKSIGLLAMIPGMGVCFGIMSDDRSACEMRLMP